MDGSSKPLLGHCRSTNSLVSITSETTSSRKGLGIITAAVFIVGTICGTGVQTIPQAIVYCGYIGPVMVIACGILSSYTGTLLGKCWTILRARYPEYEHERITDPYPTIAHRAGGKVAEIATRVSIDITLFGSDTVFMLLISENLSNLIKNMGHDEFSICYLMLIITAIITPLTWFGTPKDFWQGGIIGALTSIVASFLIFGSLLGSTNEHPNPQHAEPRWSMFFSALGTILYAYSGASCFPTIQVDMEEPNKFPISAILGIITVMSAYLLVGVSGFVVVGDDMDANVLEVLDAGWILYSVNILITSHLIFAYLINNNPVCQEIEGFLGIPDKFCFKRILVRTILAVLAMFIGLSVPHFDIILSILGGSTIALTNFIFPPLFYLLLSRQRTPSQAYGPLPSYVPMPTDDVSDPSSLVTQGHLQATKKDFKHPRWMQVDLDFHVKIILIEIICIGIFGGTSSTYFSFASLVNGESGFTVPCYLNMSVGL